MDSLTFFSNKKDSAAAAEDIIHQVQLRVDFKPDLALFYSTLKYSGKYQAMLDVFHEELGDIPQIGSSVDGMIFPDDLRMDGAALVLCKDPEAKIRVQGINEKGAMESARKLAQRIDCKKGVVILHFPLAHIPGPLKSAEFFAKGLYYSAKCKGEEKEKQKEYALKFSDYCDKENILYMPPTVLDIFAQCTDYKVPIIGINVLNAQTRFNAPNIFCNFKDIESGIAALTIEKENINAIYDDIFPDKGKTLEETKQIVQKNFKMIKELKANFEKNLLISLDGMPLNEAVKDLIYISEENEKELLEHLGKGDYKARVPYGLIFFNKKTNGAYVIGIGNVLPFDLYPLIIDVSDYSEDVALAYILVEDKFDSYVSTLNNLKFDSNCFVYFCVDVGVSAAFGKKVYEYQENIRKLRSENYFGIFSFAPSAYLPSEFQLRDNISESLKNSFSMSGGTNACLEI